MNQNYNMSDRIQGPIPQVQFNHKLNKTCNTSLKEIMKNLLDDTNTKIENINVMDGLFRLKNIVEFIFMVCVKLQLPCEVKYIAIELFAKFMQSHVKEIYDHVHNPSKDKSYSWSTVEGRVKSQVILRALSCVQISNKLTSHYSTISPQKLQELLMHCGYRYTFNSLAQSEMRILKTLNYQLPTTTPLNYIEVLLETLASSHSISFIHEVYENCIKILNFYYLDQENILAKAVKSDSYDSSNDEKKNAIRSDYALIGSSIIGAATFVVDYKSSDSILREVSELSLISASDLTELATLMIQEILAEPLEEMDNGF